MPLNILGGCIILVSYNKLWKLLIDKNMKKKDLQELAEISSSSIAKLGHNDFVSLEVLVKICYAFHCDIGDIMEVIPFHSTNQSEVNSK